MLAILSVLTLAVAALAAPSPAEPVLGVTIAAPAPAASTSSAAGPNPSDVIINSIAYGGTGCPQGSVGSFISTDRETLVNSKLLIIDKLTSL